MGFVFWCAACGNPDIIVESSNQGYNMKKRPVGTAILGSVGAVAGINGKETDVFYCPKCGARLSNFMPDYEISSILSMLKNPGASRKQLEKRGKDIPI